MADASFTIDAGRALAERLADAAGAAIRPFFRRPIALKTKADASPVTEADRAAEAAMRALLAEHVPDHGVLGEEFGATGLDREWVWVLDPIDGTKAFLSGLPTFGTLVALLHRGRPVVGVIDQPILRERWVGVAGQPTTFNGAPVRTRACAALAEASLFATSPEMFAAADAEAFGSLAARVRLTRFGLDCYAYGMLALGFVDLVVEAQLAPYDYLALAPVIEGAGGRITDWGGAPLGLAGSDGRVLAAGDPSLHAAALAALAALAGGP